MHLSSAPAAANLSIWVRRRALNIPVELLAGTWKIAIFLL
jgi:hypothetical protein